MSNLVKRSCPCFHRVSAHLHHCKGRCPITQSKMARPWYSLRPVQKIRHGKRTASIDPKPRHPTLWESRGQGLLRSKMSVTPWKDLESQSVEWGGTEDLNDRIRAGRIEIRQNREGRRLGATEQMTLDWNHLTAFSNDHGYSKT